MNPGLNKNNSFVYNNFYINLYSSDNDTNYLIEVNNITIGNGTIIHFNKMIYWKCNLSYIYDIYVFIGSDIYHFVNIYVFTIEISNITEDKEKDNLLKFSHDQYENILRELKLKVFSGDMLGVLFAIILSSYAIREIKKNTIVEI